MVAEIRGNMRATQFKRDGMPKKKEAPLRTCNFCAKSQMEVKHLIAGPRVYICEECVGVCVKIIEAREADAVENPQKYLTETT